MITKKTFYSLIIIFYFNSIFRNYNLHFWSIKNFKNDETIKLSYYII
jgi:hypothetical protein